MPWLAASVALGRGAPDRRRRTARAGSAHVRKRRRFVLDARRAVVAPEVDGEIESGEWQAASRGEDFIQFEPNRVGTIQVAYQRGTAEFGERSEQGNTLFVKLTTVL